MSAGAFESSLYTADDGTVHPCRIQPETRALAIGGTTNAAPGGPATAGAGLIHVSGGKRTIGITPRKIRVRFTGTQPTGYKAGATVSVAVLIPANFNSWRRPLYQTGTYLGAPIEVVGASPEAGRY